VPRQVDRSGQIAVTLSAATSASGNAISHTRKARCVGGLTSRTSMVVLSFFEDSASLRGSS